MTPVRLSWEGAETYGLTEGPHVTISGHGCVLEATFPAAGWTRMAHRHLSAWALQSQAERPAMAGSWGAQVCPVTKDWAFLGVKPS